MRRGVIIINKHEVDMVQGESLKISFLSFILFNSVFTLVSVLIFFWVMTPYQMLFMLSLQYPCYGLIYVMTCFNRVYNIYFSYSGLRFSDGIMIPYSDIELKLTKKYFLFGKKYEFQYLGRTYPIEVSIFTRKSLKNLLEKYAPKDHPIKRIII